MRPISYKRHRFPPEVIGYAVWLYFRFALRLRDVEDVLAERGIEVSYESIRCWTRKFGQAFARNLRRFRPRPTTTWHLDESGACSASNRRARLSCSFQPTPRSTIVFTFSAISCLASRFGAFESKLAGSGPLQPPDHLPA